MIGKQDETGSATEPLSPVAHSLTGHTLSLSCGEALILVRKGCCLEDMSDWGNAIYFRIVVGV